MFRGEQVVPDLRAGITLLRSDGKPLPDQIRVSIDGWTWEERDKGQSRRRRLLNRRSDWREHENLPPSAHEMDWETEEGRRGTGRRPVALQVGDLRYLAR